MTDQVATGYADGARLHLVEILGNEPVARDTYRLRFRCPVLAAQTRPGQFFMVRLIDGDDPLIGRPFALYDVHTVGDVLTDVEFVYLINGKMTRRLANTRAGQSLHVWGPLGNGFQLPTVEHLILVAGGIGQTPFLSAAKQFLRNAVDRRRVRVTLCYGARSAEYFAGLDEFRDAGVDLRLSTDDGSLGRHGLVTTVLAELLTETRTQQRGVLCCGPEPMLKAVAEIVCEHGVPTQVSLETPMACGIGICFSCVAMVRNAQGDADYRRTCVEGPVFDAARLVWN